MDTFHIYAGTNAGEGEIWIEHENCGAKWGIEQGTTPAQIVDEIMAHKCHDE